jgi:hypothetical protein
MRDFQLMVSYLLWMSGNSIRVSGNDRIEGIDLPETTPSKVDMEAVGVAAGPVGVVVVGSVGCEKESTVCVGPAVDNAVHVAALGL